MSTKNLNFLGPQPQICLNFDFKSITGEYSENSMIMQPITKNNVKEKAELMLEQYGRTASLFPHNMVIFMFQFVQILLVNFFLIRILTLNRKNNSFRSLLEKYLGPTKFVGNYTIVIFNRHSYHWVMIFASYSK